jgi:hypothetical protein
LKRFDCEGVFGYPNIYISLESSECVLSKSIIKKKEKPARNGKSPNKRTDIKNLLQIFRSYTETQALTPNKMGTK